MIATLLVTQGGLAEELYRAGQKIAGALPNFGIVSLGWSDDLETARQKIRAGAADLQAEDGLLILVDMYGSTPCNAALPLQEAGKVEILTGVNLPMVVRLGCLTNPLTTLSEAAEWLRGKGQGSICRAQAPSLTRESDSSPCDDPRPGGSTPCAESGS